MNVFWGAIIAVIGSLFVVAASAQSNFILYRPFVARSRIWFGDNVYRFH